MSGHPWYRWFGPSWLSSETRFSMSAAERGVYRDALDLCYAEGSIPADEATLQRLLAVSADEFKAAWPRVSGKFQPDSANPDRLVNPKAAEVLAEQEQFRRQQSEFGRKGGRPRKEKGSEKGTHKASLPKPQRVAKGNPLFSEKPNTSSSEEEEEKENAHHSDERVWVDSFESWWKEWPRKIAKTDARKAYLELIFKGKTKPDQRADLKPFPQFADRQAQLIEATEAWAREFESRSADKIPYPATFLRRLDWLTPPEPPKPIERKPETGDEFRERLAKIPPIQKSWESDELYRSRLRQEGFSA